MDKTKFTRHPLLDSEGFARSNEDIDNELNWILRQRGITPDYVCIEQRILAHMQDDWLRQLSRDGKVG